MKLLKQGLAALGIVTVVGIFAVLVTPKATHAIVATLVEVVRLPEIGKSQNLV